MSFALFAAMLAIEHSSHVAQQADNQRMFQETSVDKKRESVRYWEGILAREVEMLAKGVSSENNVDNARIRLTMTRHDLALQEHNSKFALEQTRHVFEIRERQLKRLKQLADKGFASQLEMAEGQRHQACAYFFVATEERN